MNGEGPIISITIPTKNSENTITACLDSIKSQSYTNYEIIVVDAASLDNTARIAQQKGAKVIIDVRSLLRAREIGILSSKGDYILLLDSDQVLKSDALDVCLKKMAYFDMLCLGETAVSIDSLSQRLLNSSKSVSQSNMEAYLNPYSGLLIPRFFRKDLLTIAMNSIRPEALDIVFDRDHQIIFYEAWKITKNVGYVHDIIYHNEPNSMITVLKKAFSWGYSAGVLKSSHTYDELLRKKASLRLLKNGDSFSKNSLKLLLEANVIALIKGLPYELGFIFGSLKGAKNG